MKTYLLHAGRGPKGLRIQEAASKPLGPFDVRMRVKAVSLNARDAFFAHMQDDCPPLVPCSDGAGEVMEVGPQVSRWNVGDRVVAAFYPQWLDGVPGERNTASGLGGGMLPGMLAEEVVLSEQSFVRAPSHMTFSEAATLPCAGVTAWNALMHVGGLRPGQEVLLLGTGGVSTWALQLAKASGIRSVITSSTREKLAVATSLGADATINYREQPDWSAKVRNLTNGRGVDVVIEVGGHDTIGQSIASTRMGGKIALVGGLGGGFSLQLEPFALINRAAALCSVRVGSRAMLEELVAFTELTRLKPHIDRCFPFERAPEAYEHLEAGKHVGKVIVQIGDSPRAE